MNDFPSFLYGLPQAFVGYEWGVIAIGGFHYVGFLYQLWGRERDKTNTLTACA